jgi:hypothetical protein
MLLIQSGTTTEKKRGEKKHNCPRTATCKKASIHNGERGKIVDAECN